jgi:CRISPR/Cas system-associated protein Cas10 (large subunit of type III CRISPR-Cas system)
MIVSNQLNNKLIRELVGTRKDLAATCEDLGINFQDLTKRGGPGIPQCTHCSRWEYKLIPDLDNNPICKYCRDIEGM